MTTKICKQCGELKPIEQFRKYYGGRKGHYTTCMLCERINSRAKYLYHKEALTEAEETELAQIEKLYEVERALGMQPPRTTSSPTSLTENVNELLEKYGPMQKAVSSLKVEDAPQELLNWLTCPLDQDPEYYLDSVYEGLRKKFRPYTKIDQTSMLPIYDDTYKLTLDKILERFNCYEDEYYDKE